MLNSHGKSIHNSSSDRFPLKPPGENQKHILNQMEGHLGLVSTGLAEIWSSSLLAASLLHAANPRGDLTAIRPRVAPGVGSEWLWLSKPFWDPILGQVRRF